MVSFGKVLVLWFWKSLLLRRRNWLITIFEIIVAVFCFYIIYSLNKTYLELEIKPEDVVQGFKMVTYPLEDKASYTYLAYTPSNGVIDEIMADVKECFSAEWHQVYDTTPPMFSNHSSIPDIEDWLYSQTVKETNSIAVIFNEIGFDNSNNFTYTIRVNTLEYPSLTTQISKDMFYASLQIYYLTHFLQLQSCIDASILHRLEIFPSTYNIKLGPLPNTPMLGNIIILTFLYLMVVLSTIFLVASVLTDVIQEKASGIREMMKSMGVSSWLIWFQYLIYNLLVYLPLTLVMTIFLTLLDPPVLKADFLVVWLILLLFILNTVFLLFFASCFFKNHKFANGLLIVLWTTGNIYSISIKPFSIEQVFFQILLCFFMPFINVSWALETIYSFKHYLGYFSFTSIFTVGYSGSKITIGVSMILFVSSSVLLFLITLYLEAVRPGPYGMAKHPLFIFDWIINLTKERSDANENFELKNSLPQNFEPPPRDARVGIEIRGLRKVFGRVRKEVAVNNVDLDIYKGEIMVLLGHNGAGKTTTMSMITGMFSATSGIINVDGKSLRANLPEFRKGLGLCTQHDLYFPKLSVINHLVFFGVLRGMSFSNAREDGMRLLRLLNIQDKADNLGRKLSGGMKRRLCLANALVGNPQVLILDEPTSGLDPETRRVIWNILLGFRGSRTILITTHFMEEADVLGDRIAIMDHGRVVCSGTSLFLKRIYGSGYNVHILKTPDAKESKISSLINKTIPELKMRVVSSTQVDFVVKETNVDRFPDMFSDLEKFSNDLGITGISITSATLEEVFLKVAEDSEANQKEGIEINNLYNEFEAVKGLSLFLQRVEAITKKRIVHIKRKWLSYLLRLVFSCLLIFYMIYQSEYKPPVRELQDPLVISLENIYPGTVNLVKSPNNPPLKDSVTNILKRQKAAVQFLPDNQDVNDFIENLAKEDFMAYLNEALLGITVSSTELIVQYQPLMSVHIPAIALNLIPNILMNSKNIDGHIKVINHPYVLIEKISDCPSSPSSQSLYLSTKVHAWLSYTFLAMIICLPGYMNLISEELSSGFKHQQMIAGLSSVTYWFSNFMFDFIFYFLTILIWLFIILLMGSQHILIDNYDLMLLMLMILVLSGLSNVAFVYFVTYITRGGRSEMIVMVLNIIVLIATIIVYVQLSTIDFNIVLIIFCVFSLNPTFAAVMSLTFIVEVMIQKYICRICGHPAQCEVRNKIFEIPTDKDRKSILIFTIFLATLWIPYLLLLLLLDSNLYRKIFMTFFRSAEDTAFHEEEDDDVVAERELVEYTKEDGAKCPLLVHNLIKKYMCGPKAVDKVSFLVERGECFGLLGVNGAGKTTTFKILTGEIIPNSGNAEVSNISVFNRDAYMQKIGYCPQFDACLKMMTGREILTIVALIRGVPRSEVSLVVNNWLELMGITEHGNKKTAAYSGGTRRKLSTAMAFMGKPTVVFLDEPTTGVDPVSRRKLWSVIQARQRAGQALVLTSHSMEECEALCTRLTIMRQGRMRCIGAVEYLKNKFRLGFIVDVKFLDPTVQQITQFKKDFTNSFPGAQLMDESHGMVQFTVLDAERPLSNTFAEMLRLKKQHSAMQDFTVNNTTLEQLFLSFANK